MPGRDIAVAPVIARSAQDQRLQRPRETVDRFGEARSCPLHQLFDAGAAVDRRLLGNAHPLSGEYRSSSHCRARLTQEGREMPPFTWDELRRAISRLLAFEQRKAGRTGSGHAYNLR